MLVVEERSYYNNHVWLSIVAVALLFSKEMMIIALYLCSDLVVK